jgi:hypothetical protein
MFCDENLSNAPLNCLSLREAVLLSSYGTTAINVCEANIKF